MITNIETIERVYRLLAKRYHPDNNGSGNTEKFEVHIDPSNYTTAVGYKVELVSADPEKRAAFDVKYEKERTRQFKVWTYLKHLTGAFREPRNIFFCIAQRALKAINEYGIQFFQYFMLKSDLKIRLNPELACGNWKNCLVGLKRFWSFILGISKKRVGLNSLIPEDTQSLLTEWMLSRKMN